MGFVRVMLLLLAVLTVAYLILSVTLRLSERRRLAREWEHSGDGRERRDYVAAGMEAYDRSLRRWLPWLVIVAPMAGFGLLLYLLNVS